MIDFKILSSVCKYHNKKGCGQGKNFGGVCDFSVCPLMSIQDNTKLLAAIHVVEEMQRWRRERPPYDGDTPETHREMPYSAKGYGAALDIILKTVKKNISPL